MRRLPVFIALLAMVSLATGFIGGAHKSTSMSVVLHMDSVKPSTVSVQGVSHEVPVTHSLLTAPPKSYDAYWIISSPGTYTLSSDLIGITNEIGILIDADDVYLDGRGYSLVGAGSSFTYGIYICEGRKNITIVNINIGNWTYGIYLNRTLDAIISYSNISDCATGIHMYRCNLSNLYISANMIHRVNIEHIDYYGIALMASDNVQILDSNISECGCDGIIMENTTNSVIADNLIEDCEYGLLLSYSSNQNLVNNNRFINCGMMVWYSKHNNVVDNTVNDGELVYIENKRNIEIWGKRGQMIIIDSANIEVWNFYSRNASIGIQLVNVSNIRINGANNHDDIYGVFLHNATNIELRAGHQESCMIGIYALNATNVTIWMQIIEYNYDYGVYIVWSKQIYIFANDFIGNSYHFEASNSEEFQCYSPRTVYYEYNGTPHINFIGNYWAEYSCIDSDGDGICDEGYSAFLDLYPLVSRQWDYYSLEIIKPLKAVFFAPSNTTIVDTELVEREFSIKLNRMADKIQWYINGTIEFEEVNASGSSATFSPSYYGVYNICVAAIDEMNGDVVRVCWVWKISSTVVEEEEITITFTWFGIFSLGSIIADIIAIILCFRFEF